MSKPTVDTLKSDTARVQLGVGTRKNGYAGDGLFSLVNRQTNRIHFSVNAKKLFVKALAKGGSIKKERPSFPCRMLVDLC
jgi:hypothetical protein